MTLTEFEAGLISAPSWQRCAAGPAYALRQRLATGEAPFTAARDAIAVQHYQPLAASQQAAVFAALTGP
jgi:hypothetical protein